MATGDRDRVIIAEAVAKCWQDADFRAKFVQDPAAALRASGMEVAAGTTVKVYENTPDITYLGLSHTQPIKEYEATLNAFLESHTPLRPGGEIRLVQSANEFLPIILPVAPHAFMQGEISDADLMAMAGGSYLWQSANVATAAEAVNAAVEATAAVTSVAGAAEVAAGAAAVAAAVIAVVLI